MLRNSQIAAQSVGFSLILSAVTSNRKPTSSTSSMTPRFRLRVVRPQMIPTFFMSQIFVDLQSKPGLLRWPNLKTWCQSVFLRTNYSRFFWSVGHRNICESVKTRGHIFVVCWCRKQSTGLLQPRHSRSHLFLQTPSLVSMSAKSCFTWFFSASVRSRQARTKYVEFASSRKSGKNSSVTAPRRIAMQGSRLFLKSEHFFSESYF